MAEEEEKEEEDIMRVEESTEKEEGLTPFRPIPEDDTRRIRKLFAGLPYFTATPTHKGMEGELALIRNTTTSTYKICTYLNSAWKCTDIPATGGDMFKITYDTDTNDKVDSADNSDKLESSTKAQVQDHTPKAHLLNSHTAPNGNINMNVHKIIGVTDPDNAQDAATKAYVDTQAALKKIYQFVLPCELKSSDMYTSANIYNIQVSTTVADNPDYICTIQGKNNIQTYYLKKYRKLTAGTYILDKAVSITKDSNVVPIGICQIGSYIYVSITSGAADKLYRYNLDLVNETEMTFDVVSGHGNLASDGTYLYMLTSITNVYKFSISGTALSDEATITLAANVRYGGVFQADGTYLYAVVSATSLLTRFYVGTGNAGTGAYAVDKYDQSGTTWYYCGMVKMGTDFAIVAVNKDVPLLHITKIDDFS